MSKPNEDAKEVARLTRAKVAELVSIEEPAFDKEGKPTGKTKTRKLKAAEIFAFREYADHVVVCTVAGQKLKGDK